MVSEDEGMNVFGGCPAFISSGCRTTLGFFAGGGMTMHLWLREQHHSVQFSRSVVSDSLQPHESQHARPPCPSPTPGVHSNSCPLSWWWHPAVSSSVFPSSSCPQSLPASVFSTESTLPMRWPKYWSFSFSISSSSEHPGLISLQSKGLSGFKSKGFGGRGRNMYSIKKAV